MKKLLLIVILLIATNIFSQSFPEPVRFSYSGRDTASTGDTASRKISTNLNTLSSTYQNWYQGIFTTDDTITVSTDTLYSNAMIVYPDESLLTPKFNIRYFKNLYWKVLGSGVATVRYYLFGN